MKQKVALHVVMLVLITVPAAATEEPPSANPAMSHDEGKAGSPEGEHKLDFRELFGCEPMGEEGHKPMPRPASGVGGPGAMQPVQERPDAGAAPK